MSNSFTPQSFRDALKKVARNSSDGKINVAVLTVAINEALIVTGGTQPDPQIKVGLEDVIKGASVEIPFPAHAIIRAARNLKSADVEAAAAAVADAVGNGVTKNAVLRATVNLEKLNTFLENIGGNNYPKVDVDNNPKCITQGLSSSVNKSAGNNYDLKKKK